MPAAACHGDLEVGLAKQRIEPAYGECERRRSGITAGRPVELCGTARRVAQQIKRLPRNHAGDLMLAVPVGRGPGEDRDDDLRPEALDDRDDVFEDRIARPETKRLFCVLGKAEVVGAREELAGAVELPRREQLLRADDAELGTQLRSDQVLPAFAPAERQVRDLRTHAPRKQHEQLRVFVIGMRADHEDALVAAELSQQARQGSDAAGTSRRKLRVAGTGGADTKEER
jgi:hypothetical protein